MRIDQLDVKPALFEHCEQRTPVDPGRLHHDGLNPALLQPCGQGVEIGGTCSKALHRLCTAILGHRHPMGVRPYIHPGGMKIALLSLRGARPTGASLP
jgi:hypothetical protein